MIGKFLLMSYLLMPNVENIIFHVDVRKILDEIIDTAIELEIMDERERPFFTKDLYANETQLDSIKIFYNRYQDLKDVPKIQSINNYAPFNRNQIQDFIMFNRKFQNYLEQEMLLNVSNYKARECGDALHETKILFSFWDSVRDAKTEFYYIHVRRYGLKKVIGAIGEENFYNGNFPDSVPTWRFREMSR